MSWSILTNKDLENTNIRFNIAFKKSSASPKLKPFFPREAPGPLGIGRTVCPTNNTQAGAYVFLTFWLSYKTEIRLIFKLLTF